jgi:hypothetical protein
MIASRPLSSQLRTVWLTPLRAWFCLGLWLCAGCMSAYAPAAPVVPLLAKQGDVVAGAKLRPAMPRRGMSAYLAAAPSDATRVYASGTWARARGRTTEDGAGRRLKERNDTSQAELGGGWGTTRPKLRAELLGGLGFGRTTFAQCRRAPLDEYGDCVTWVDGRARLARLFAQGQVAARLRWWTGGGGMRISLGFQLPLDPLWR